MNSEDAARPLLEGNSLRVEADGETYFVSPDEVEVKALAKEGFAVAEDGPYVAALVTDLTPKLVQEGLAREFVRRVQDLRKSAELDVADRIELFVEASAGLRSAVEAHKEYITAETLTSNLVFGSPPEGASLVDDEFDGETVRAGLLKK
jgi:isoleucyl-tRNA synthetase